MYGAYACGAAHVPMYDERPSGNRDHATYFKRTPPPPQKSVDAALARPRDRGRRARRYEQQKPSEWEYILNDSEAKVLFVSKKELLPAAREAAKKHAVEVRATKLLLQDSAVFDVEPRRRREGATSDLPRAIQDRRSRGRARWMAWAHGLRGADRGGATWIFRGRSNADEDPTDREGRPRQMTWARRLRGADRGDDAAGARRWIFRGEDERLGAGPTDSSGAGQGPVLRGDGRRGAQLPRGARGGRGARRGHDAAARFDGPRVAHLHVR